MPAGSNTRSGNIPTSGSDVVVQRGQLTKKRHRLSPTMPVREDLVSSALTFLSDPKVQSSTLTKRLSFLESKGLTQEEITEVLNRLNSTSPASPSPTPIPAAGSTTPPPPPVPQYAPYGNPYGQPPEPPSRDWRDWFIMAVVSSGVSYGLYTLAKVRPRIHVLLQQGHN